MIFPMSLGHFPKKKKKKGQEWRGRELKLLIRILSYVLTEFQIYYTSVCCSRPHNFLDFYIAGYLNNLAKVKPAFTAPYPQVNLNFKKWRLSWHGLKAFLRNRSHVTTVSRQKFIPSSMTKRTVQRDRVHTLSMPWLYSKKTW